MIALILTVFVGAGLGAGIGCFSRCSSGACPFVATWRRGAVAGAAVAAVLYFVSGQGTTVSMNQSTRDVARLRPDQFEAEVLSSTLPVVVDFYATWCGPCRTLAPRLDGLAGQYSGRIKFVKINIDEAPALAQRYQIQAIPTLLFFKDGKLADNLVGLPSTPALKARLDSLAGAGSSASSAM
jgi:thioredoxin 1